MAFIVLNPKFKFKYFKEKQTRNKASFVKTRKSKLKKIWDNIYKKEAIIQRLRLPPRANLEVDYIARILNQVALLALTLSRHFTRKDQLALYLEELVSQISIIDYQRSKEVKWPQLASMAFDFLAILAISSKCERVFSSYTKMTTIKSSKLSRLMLQHQECLKNQQRRGAIVIASAYNAILIA